MNYNKVLIELEDGLLFKVVVGRPFGLNGSKVKRILLTEDGNNAQGKFYTQ